MDRASSCPSRFLGREKKCYRKTLLKESLSVVWVLCEFFSTKANPNAPRQRRTLQKRKRVNCPKLEKLPFVNGLRCAALVSAVFACLFFSEKNHARKSEARTVESLFSIGAFPLGSFSIFSCRHCAAHETWLKRNRYLIVAAFQGISAEKEVNKKDQQQKKKKEFQIFTKISLFSSQQHTIIKTTERPKALTFCACGGVLLHN